MSDPVAAPVTVDPRRARQLAQAASTDSLPQSPAPAESAMEDVQEPTAAPAEASEPTVEAPASSVSSDLTPLPSSTLDSPLPPPSAETANTAAYTDSAHIDADTAPATEFAVAETQTVEQSTSEAALSAEMDAAIAATLAMETEEAAAAPPSGEAAARGDGTPALYAGNGAADVPAAVATPPLASSSSNSKPKQQTSLSRFAQLTARVERDPLDGEAQLALLQDAVQKGDLERTREVYEKFLTVFPDAVSLESCRRSVSSPRLLPSSVLSPVAIHLFSSSLVLRSYTNLQRQVIVY